MLNSLTITDAQQAAPNLMNFYQGSEATFPGTYDNTTPNSSVAYFNQAMMVQAENFDPFLQAALIEQPKYWYNAIPRGAFQFFSGATKETRIYRGGAVHYGGLADWADIDPVPTATNNPCGARGYKTYPYAYERLEWSGKDIYWGSDPVCLNQLRFINQAAQQLAWILQSGADVGISLQEVWNRDKLLDISRAVANKSYVMTSSFVGNTAPERFYYDPFTTAASVTDTEVKAGLSAQPSLPFFVFKWQEVEPLNFDVLDAEHQVLSIEARSAGMGNNGGIPTYGLPIAYQDFERYIKGNEYERRNWTEARPEELIKGMMGMNYKNHRNYTMMFDENQFRGKILKVVEDYDSSQFGGVGSDLDGETVIVAQFVPPRVEGRLGENGQPIMESNPEYITAPLAITPIMMKDVFFNEMGTEITTLGSQTYFGPQAGLNGKWSWVNEYDKDYNSERLVGNFRGKFEIWPRPSSHAVHATSFLYRRCTEPLKSICPVANANVNFNYGVTPQAVSSYAVSASDVANDTITASVIMPVTLGDLCPGAAVTVALAGHSGDLNGSTVNAYVYKTASASKYVLHLTGITGLVATDPGAGATGYFVDGSLLKYRADTEVETVTFGAVTLA